MHPDPHNPNHPADPDDPAEPPVSTILNNHQLLATAMALGSLDPDEEEAIWRTRRLMPMALHARLHPSFESALRWLARQWSSGALRGRPARHWLTPDALTGRTRAWTFAFEWPRLVAGPFGLDTLDIDVIRQDADELEQYLDEPLPTLHFEAPDFELEPALEGLQRLRWLLH
jgi:hypothetical protein